MELKGSCKTVSPVDLEIVTERKQLRFAVWAPSANGRFPVTQRGDPSARLCNSQWTETPHNPLSRERSYGGQQESKIKTEETNRN